NPKPGASYADNQPVQYLIPDATIEKTETGYSIHMHDEYIPTIHISREYRQMIQTGDAETVRFLSEKLRTAEQLMAGISQRKSTIHRVLEVIVRVQAEFLEKGSRFLAPMSQKEVAEELSVHESTVSRATTEKYVYTPQGLFELKYFFSTEMKTEDGEEVSARAIQAMIQDIVNNENKKKPLSDAKITEQLVSEGFAISRRTVAKYREAIGIPKSSVRKAFR
ncbi:MAG: RNA polymerase sigma-54 factor, partial [Bacillota bacterium]|nr:RNA polymerase sigma-54 factor [Bacillota bacterium]